MERVEVGPWAFRLLTGGSVPWDPGGRGFRAVVERRRASGYVFGGRASWLLATVFLAPGRRFRAFWWPWRFLAGLDRLFFAKL